MLRFAAATALSGTQTRFALYAVESASVVAQRFTLSVDANGVAVESFAGLSLSEDHPRYFAKDDVVNGVSAIVTVAHGTPARRRCPSRRHRSTWRRAIGADKPADERRLPRGADPAGGGRRAGDGDLPDALCSATRCCRPTSSGQVVRHCEDFRRFAILDAPDSTRTAVLEWRNTTVASTYAAVFAPHLRIVTLDPDATDRYRRCRRPASSPASSPAPTGCAGVHKAPGNETVSGIVGLTQAYTQRRQDLLNPGGVNLIRAFPGRGTRIWGARNATDDATWRYINVRRLFNMIEASVDRATQWVVFEPNTAQTWIRVKVSVENFLDQQWRAGALAGTKPEQAYRVRVGLGETMTETDIDLGLIITEVAVAPAKPAEFVIFRFSHKRLSE